MRSAEFITEGRSHPIIVVDVQPEYASKNAKICRNIVKFVVGSTGPVLMFVNSEKDRLTDDTIDDIKYYWEEVIGYTEDENGDLVGMIDWSRFQIVDKGYGYLRSWMDQGISSSAIIKTIRMMYQEKVSDSRELFGGQNSPDYESGIKGLLGPDYLVGLDDPISVGWTSVSQLKQFSGAYLVGGGREECLREVELLMSAFNIRYKRIDSLVYG